MMRRLVNALVGVAWMRTGRELMDLLIDLAVAPVDPYAAAFGSRTSRRCAVPTRQEVKRLKRQARKMAVCSLQ